MRLAQNENSNSRGFSLIEIMIAIGILSILSAGITKMMVTQTNSIENIKETMTVDAIQAQIIRALNDPGYFNASLANPQTNGLFVACHNATGPCNFGGAALDFNLYQPGGNVLIAGGFANPVFYQRDGTNCGAAGSVKCPISVTVQFSVSCLGNTYLPVVQNCGATNAATYTFYYLIQEPAAFKSPNMTAMKPVCNYPVPAMYPAGVTCGGMQINMSSSSGTPAGNPRHLAWWNTNNTLGFSSMLSDDGATPPGQVIGVACNAASAGVLRTLTSAGATAAYVPGASQNYGRVEVCEYSTAQGGWAWTYISGPVDSGAFGNKWQRLPMMNGMYLCPVLLANSFACGGMPACHGQIQSEARCCANNTRFSACGAGNCGPGQVNAQPCRPLF